MKHLKLSILLLALLCLALQCNKDDNNEPKDVTRLSEEFKDYAYFKEGSWWVYKELNSGDLDSAYIIRSDILIEHIPKKSGGPEDYEFFSLNIVREFYQSNNKDTLILEGIPGLPSDSKVGKRVVGQLSQTIFKYNIVQVNLFKILSNKSDSVIDLYIAQIKKIDSIKILNKKYEDVYVVLHKDQKLSETNDLIKKDFYAKNVGLIRREFLDGRVKELLRYNVKQ